MTSKLPSPFASLPDELIADLCVSDGAVRLWARLDRYAREKRTAWPSRATLASELGCSVKTIDRRLDELVNAGWLTITHRRTVAGDPDSNLYTLGQTGGVTDGGTPKDDATWCHPWGQGGVTDGGTGGVTDDALIETQFERDELNEQAVPEFDELWSQYPPRNGQRLGKKNAIKQWARLSPIDRIAATASLPLYASTTNGFPKDAERYLRGRLWADLDHDAKPPSAKNDRALADFLDVVLPDTPDTEALIA